MHYDLFVIGGGSGGVAAARSSSALGAKVGLAEYEPLGGTCVNRGCMPKKFYMYASSYADEFANAKSYGWDVPTPKFDWQTLKDNTFKEISRLNGIYGNLLDKFNVTHHQGFARFVDENTVDVDGQKITADKFIIATGGTPFVPDIPGSELAITSDQAFHLEKLPQSILIVGGGYIAVEFAHIFNKLGVDTSLMIRREHILAGFDADIREFSQKALVDSGVTLLNKHSPKAIEKEGGLFRLNTQEGESFKAEHIMFATGRKPLVDKLNLDVTGVKLDANGTIEVDQWQATNVAHIYAMGDVTNTHANLTPVAINEGRAFADTHFGGVKRNIEQWVLPTAVFSQPPIGTVGLTEEQARETYTDVEVYKAQFRSSKFSLSKMEQFVLMKLIVDKASNKVVGAHMAGQDAPEIIQIMGVALRSGATKEEFDQTIGVHPSIAEEFVTMRVPFKAS